jgi:ABC-2 type transport system permease protein
MLRNVFLKTLRDNRWGTLLVGLGLGLMYVIVVVEYQEFIGNPAQLADFTRAYQAFGFLVGEYVPIDTLGGFMTIEILVYTAVVLAVWLAVMGVAVIRGEEEPGTLDLLLATPQARGAVFAQKAAALGVCLLVALALSGAPLALGLWMTNQTLPLAGVLATGLNCGVLAAVWGAGGLLLGQVVASRHAAVILAAGGITATFLLDNLVTTVPRLKNLTWLLPFHYYNLSKPLVPGRTLDAGAVAILILGAAALLILAAWLFARRDVGAAFALWPAWRPPWRGAPGGGGGRLLGSVFAKSVRDQGAATLAWGLALALYGALMVGTITEALAPMYRGMNMVPWFTKLFGTLVTNEGYLSVALFFYFPVVLAIFALTHLWGWTSEEEEGRLELLLAHPVARRQVVMARYGAAVLSLAGVLALMLAGLLVAAGLIGVELDTGRIVAATLGAAPVALVALAFGLALAAWLPRPGVAVGVTGALIIAMFLLTTLAPLFDWPEAVRRLSVFHYYGRPVLDGVAWPDMVLLLGAAAAFFALTLVGFQRRNIAT